MADNQQYEYKGYNGSFILSNTRVTTKKSTKDFLIGESPIKSTTESSWRDTLVLLAYLLLSILLYLLLTFIAPSPGGPTKPFFLVWTSCFLCYSIACTWVMGTRFPIKNRRWIQLGIIFVGAAAFRLMLLHLPASLSNDAWCYLWDARVILHGYSPYIYAPQNQVLVPLRDIVYANCLYHEFSTKYPPGAEFFYLLGYLLSPTSLIALKGLLVLCEMLTCGALTLLLIRKGLDSRYVIIYAWCPLPIVEFAVQGHIDALVTTFTVIAILCSLSARQAVRLLSGVFIGLATLTKLYPLLFLLALVHRQDWRFLIACTSTIVLGYSPILLLSHGQITAVLFSFGGQETLHPSFMQHLLFILGHNFGTTPATMLVVGRIIAVTAGSIIMFVVLLQRLRRRISVEGALLLLTGMALSVFSYTFPWYVPMLLPWIAVLVASIWKASKGFSAKRLAIMIIWLATYFVLLVYLPDLR